MSNTCAVVGFGYWGPNLVRNLVSIPDCRVKMVCDKDPQRLNAVTSQYPALQGPADFNAVLEDDEIDTVFIVTPVRSHFPLARLCLEAGKHTFVEKPLAASTRECEGLIDLAEKNGLTLMVGHTFIYSAAVRKMKEVIDSGTLGEVLHFSARRLNLGLFQRDINVVWDLAPHDISIINYLMGRAPVTVNCQGKAHFTPGIEDIATLSLGYPNGNFAVIDVSWIDPRKVRELTIVGSKRMLVYDDLEPLEKIKIYDKSVEVPPHYDTFAEFQYSYHYGDVTSPYLRLTEPLRVECQHFMDCIRTGARPESGGIEGLAVTRVLEASSRSLAMDGAKVGVETFAAVAASGTAG
jgi:predicted dehydrogenase